MERALWLCIGLWACSGDDPMEEGGKDSVPDEVQDDTDQEQPETYDVDGLWRGICFSPESLPDTGSIIEQLEVELELTDQEGEVSGTLRTVASHASGGTSPGDYTVQGSRQGAELWLTLGYAGGSVAAAALWMTIDGDSMSGQLGYQATISTTYASSSAFPPYDCTLSR